MSKTSMKLVLRDMTKLTVKEQEEYAKIFSEGDTNLEELLKFLWSNGINTFASCAGHREVVDEEVINEKPYIILDISSLNETELKNMIKRLIELNELTTTDKAGIVFELEFCRFHKEMVELGYVGDTQRRSISIEFKDIDCANFEGLLKVFKRVKTNRNSIFSKIKSKFKQDKSIADLKEFIEICNQLNEIDLSAKNYGRIALGYIGDSNSLKQRVTVLRPAGTTVCCYRADKNIEDKNKDFRLEDIFGEDLEVAPGYATETYDGKFLTEIDGDIVALQKEQIQGLKIFDFAKGDMYGDFDAEKMRGLIEEINNSKNLNI